jgi:uncharacterized protein (DUF302 family)
MSTTANELETILPLAFDETVLKVREELAKEGFGVITEIDVRGTMKKKLDRDFRDYVILGACNPALAFRALSARPDVGLLLPCNVCVWSEETGRTVVSAFDPLRAKTLFGDDEQVEAVAREVHERMARVVASLRG